MSVLTVSLCCFAAAATALTTTADLCLSNVLFSSYSKVGHVPTGFNCLHPSASSHWRNVLIVCLRQILYLSAAAVYSLYTRNFPGKPWLADFQSPMIQSSLSWVSAWDRPNLSVSDVQFTSYIVAYMSQTHDWQEVAADWQWYRILWPSTVHTSDRLDLQCSVQTYCSLISHTRLSPCSP